MKILVVTVNYKNTNSTSDLIKSIENSRKNGNVKIIIADNASTKSSLRALNQIKKNYSNEIKIIPFKENKYYWPAISTVITNLKNKNLYNPDWILVCNNDIIFSDKYFFENIIGIDKNKYPIIGPDVVNKEGKKLNPFMRRPLNRLEHFYWRLYFFSYPTSIIINTIKNIFKRLIPIEKINNNDKIYSVYAVHGSAILFSSKFFELGGWFDDNFEMYAEELTVAGIAEKLKINITVNSKLKVIHKEHSMTKTINKKKLFEKARASHRFARLTYMK